MRKSNYLLGLLLSGSILMNAQDAETVVVIEETAAAPLEFSGSVDTYFRQNITGLNNQAPSSSFGQHPGFALGMVNLIAAKEGKKTGFVADLVFGPRGDDAVFGSLNASGDPSNSAIINQLYAYWNVSDKLTLTMGNFNTFLGYEVISPTGNFNYSTSYMFSYGPFSHTGLKADISLTDKLSLALAVMNPTDATDWNSSFLNSYTLGAQLGYEVEKGGAWLNFLYGDQDGRLAANDSIFGPGVMSNGPTFQVDLTTGWNLTEKFYLGFNTTLNTTMKGNMTTIDGGDLKVESDTTSDFKPKGFMGVAIYPQYQISDALKIGFRGEYFAEMQRGAGAIGAYDVDGAASIIDLTLSLNYTIGDLTLIPEIRYDMASEDVFYDRSSIPTNGLASFLLAAVYKF